MHCRKHWPLEKFQILTIPSSPPVMSRRPLLSMPSVVTLESLPWIRLNLKDILPVRTSQTCTEPDTSADTTWEEEEGEKEGIKERTNE
jgi:hypothetical protein